MSRAYRYYIGVPDGDWSNCYYVESDVFVPRDYGCREPAEGELFVVDTNGSDGVTGYIVPATELSQIFAGVYHWANFDNTDVNIPDDNFPLELGYIVRDNRDWFDQFYSYDYVSYFKLSVVMEYEFGMNARDVMATLVR